METAVAPSLAYMPLGGISIMPSPGPLGRLIQRRRLALNLTQDELAEATERCGVGERVPQNQISRLESGKIRRIQEPKRLEALAKVLELDSDIEFILLAYGPDGIIDKFRQMIQVGAAKDENGGNGASDLMRLDARTRDYVRRFAALPPEDRRYIEGAIDFSHRGRTNHNTHKNHLKS